MKLGCQFNYHKGRAAIRHYANLREPLFNLSFRLYPAVWVHPAMSPGWGWDRPHFHPKYFYCVVKFLCFDTASSHPRHEGWDGPGFVGQQWPGQRGHTALWVMGVLFFKIIQKWLLTSFPSDYSFWLYILSKFYIKLATKDIFNGRNKKIISLFYPMFSTPRYPQSAVASEMSPAELLLPQHSTRQLRLDNGQLRTTQVR